MGSKPVVVPDGVTVSVGSKNQVAVQGPRGTLNQAFDPSMSILVEGGQVRVERPSDQRHHRALHGLTRALCRTWSSA